jgi:hypothetical protein
LAPAVASRIRSDEIPSRRQSIDTERTSIIGDDPSADRKQPAMASYIRGHRKSELSGGLDGATDSDLVMP